jgi:hypothetical protein
MWKLRLLPLGRRGCRQSGDFFLDLLELALEFLLYSGDITKTWL